MNIFASKLINRKKIIELKIFPNMEKAIDQIRIWDNNSWLSFSIDLTKYKYSSVSLPASYLMNAQKYKVFHGEEFLFSRLAMKPDEFYKASINKDIKNIKKNKQKFIKYSFSLIYCWSHEKP